MQLNYVIQFYKDVINDYDSNRFTQEQLAEKYKCPVDAIRWCTQYYGYHHTKASSGKNVMFHANDPKFLELASLLDRK